MHRFYCPGANFSSKTVHIHDQNEIHHLRDVLRLKKGDTVKIFNQNTREAAGTIRSCNATEVVIALNPHSVREFKPPVPSILLACAIPKRTKFEWIIEKATELGADEIVPLKTKRTELNLRGERLARKGTRYQTVAVNAAKQCRRSTVPAVHPVTDFTEALAKLGSNKIVFIPSLAGERENILTVFKRHKSPKEVAFLIGPEGDFTPQEYAQARERGCIPVSLGGTVLKVETAAVTAVACASLYYRGG